jgi:peroxiredoxin Q/BCP
LPERRVVASWPAATPVHEEDADMVSFASRTFGVVLVAMILGMTVVTVGPEPARAVEVGQPAPDFTLAATTGGDISLKDYLGKKWVLIEFYGADFVPT